MKTVCLFWLMLLTLSLHPLEVSGGGGETPKSRLGNLIIDNWGARRIESQGEESLEVTLDCVNKATEDDTLAVSVIWRSGPRIMGSIKSQGKESVTIHPGEKTREKFLFKGVNRKDQYSVWIMSKNGEAMIYVNEKLLSSPPTLNSGWATYYETSELPKDGHKEYFAKLPEAYYLPYSAENYAICYGKGCHDRAIETEETWQGTNFRNPGRNLHFQHVKGTQGRNCKACHTAEETDQDKMMRRQVPYNNWILPVNYTGNRNGGLCEVGCHRRLEYSRTYRVD